MIRSIVAGDSEHTVTLELSYGVHREVTKAILTIDGQRLVMGNEAWRHLVDLFVTLLKVPLHDRSA